MLTIAPVGNRDPQIGEVVAFTSPKTGRMAVHRVVLRTADGWLMRGDNSVEADGVVGLEGIIGRVVRVERKGREVRLGVRFAGEYVARLNRGTGLAGLRNLWRLPRSSAAVVVRMAQGTRLYGAIGASVAGPVSIAEATEEDLATVRGRTISAIPESERNEFPEVANWVARCGPEVVGYIQYVVRSGHDSPWAGHWLFSLRVWPRFRGLGIGEKLTRHAIANATERGATELRLAVFERNDRAIRLYEKLGFEYVVLPQVEPWLVAEAEQLGRRRIVMRLRLSSAALRERS